MSLNFLIIVELIFKLHYYDTTFKLFLTCLVILTIRISNEKTLWSTHFGSMFFEGLLNWFSPSPSPSVKNTHSHTHTHTHALVSLSFDKLEEQENKCMCSIQQNTLSTSIQIWPSYPSSAPIFVNVFPLKNVQFIIFSSFRITVLLMSDLLCVLPSLNPFYWTGTCQNKIAWNGMRMRVPSRNLF